MEKFQNLEYIRPSFEETEKDIYAALKEFNEAADYETAKKALLRG